MDIGQKIRHLRNEKKLEQIELAELMDMSSNMISMYELGKKKPSLKAIERMAQIFEVSINYFLEEKVDLIRNNSNNSASVTEKIVEELKNQLDFLRRMLEMESEKNNRLSKTLENLTSNFPEGNDIDSSPIIGEVVILRAA